MLMNKLKIIVSFPIFLVYFVLLLAGIIALLKRDVLSVKHPSLKETAIMILNYNEEVFNEVESYEH